MLCGNLNKAWDILQSQQITNTSKILHHTWVNDIDNEHHEDIAYNLTMLAEEYKEKFSWNSCLCQWHDLTDYILMKHKMHYLFILTWR